MTPVEPIKHEIIGREVDERLPLPLVALRYFVHQEMVERKVEHLIVASDHQDDGNGSTPLGCQGGTLVVPAFIIV